MTNAEVAAAVVALLVMLAGLVGIVVPVLPGVPLIWLAALGYALVEGFNSWTDAVMGLVLTGLAAASVVVDLILGPVGARRGGASWAAIGASLAGGVIGMLFFPPLGALIGALLGVFVVEYRRGGQNARLAWEATKGFAKGYGLSILINLGLAALMIVIWGFWVFIESDL